MGPSETDRAWAAGFFDGEGSTFAARSVKKGRVYYFPGADLGQTDPEVLQRFHRVVGVGHLNGPYQPKNPKARPRWVWGCAGLTATAVLMNVLWPYLGTVKRAQYEAAMKKHREHIPHPV